MRLTTTPDAGNPVLTNSQNGTGNTLPAGLTWDYSRTFVLYRTTNGINVSTPYLPDTSTTPIVRSVITIPIGTTWDIQSTNTLATHRSKNNIAYVTTNDSSIHLTSLWYYLPVTANAGPSVAGIQLSIRKVG